MSGSSRCQPVHARTSSIGRLPRNTLRVPMWCKHDDATSELAPLVPRRPAAHRVIQLQAGHALRQCIIIGVSCVCCNHLHRIVIASSIADRPGIRSVVSRSIRFARETANDAQLAPHCQADHRGACAASGSSSRAHTSSTARAATPTRRHSSGSISKHVRPCWSCTSTAWPSYTTSGGNRRLSTVSSLGTTWCPQTLWTRRTAE